MPNTKSFVVNAEFMINRVVWRTLGYGDQPSKVEVGELLEAFLTGVGTGIEVKLRYQGAPGHYKAVMKVDVEAAWWRRMGLGDSASKAEVQVAVADFLSRIARRNGWSLSVELVK